MMHGAGRDMKMKTFIIGPVNIGIGSRIYPSDIYVVPIDDVTEFSGITVFPGTVTLDISGTFFAFP
jgi:hypothetical protein